MLQIFKKLSDAKTTAAFDETIPQLEKSMAELDQQLLEFETRREELIFAGDEAGLTKLVGQVASARSNRENVVVALDGARRRRQEAAEREHKVTVEKRMAEAPRHIDEQRQLLKQFDKQAKALADTAAKLGEVSAVIRAENEFARANGRSDLALTDVYTELFRLINARWDAFWSKAGGKPGNRPVAVPDPTVALRLPYHWPAQPERSIWTAPRRLSSC